MIVVLSTSPYPGSALSNFTPHAFTFDDIHCASMEGLLQAFKFSDPKRQIQLCELSGPEAKIAGRAGDGWKVNQTLWWDGKDYIRHSEAYQSLLNRAFLALGRNKDFRQALLDTRQKDLSHPIGSPDPSKTILTEAEFIGRLKMLRNRYQS